ncbi:rough deal [Anopheles darlingi]|uniref:Rough deal n=1 Tax=Anopheles darlingi TaxID=43151 RepID=W5JGF4_ANODA|nr:rough deal [Anopheles darlingi]
MELKQEMEMSEHTWLVQQPKNSANIYYIVGHTHREPVVQEIELKILSETDPSQRLVKLIKIGRLDEAEVFACQFGLDVQLVHQARAKALLGELSTSGDIETTFAKLMTALANVNDHAFLISIHDTPISDRNMKRRFLQFLLTKLTATEGPEMESVIEINERMLRIETLKLIDPYDIDQDWQQFVYHDNLPQLCTELFQKDMDAACLIWSRHIACILPQLDEVKVAALLGRIPKETSPLHLVQWLLHFVSPILHHHPQMMHLLVQYIIEKTKSYQKLATWPMVGLTFIEDVIKILEDVQFPLIDLRLQYNSNMDELQRLASALRDLVTLKQQFNLQASLDCYMHEDIESTAVRLLQITPLNLLNRIVTEFLSKFFIGKEASLYQQIVRYIRFLLANQYSSFWDQRCITLVELLYDEQQQMETVLAILKAAPVPWSPTIASLMKYAACDHPIAEEIVMAQNSQTIKCLQMKYGWSVKAQYDPRLLVQRVLTLHKPEMLTDIETIVRTTPALAFFTDLNVIAKLAEAGEGIVAAKYLDGLEETRKAACCQGAIGMMINMVDAGNTLAMAYLEILQMLKHRADPEQQNAIQQIVHIMQLRNEFGLNVNPQALGNTTSRKELLLSGIRFILSKIQHKSDQFLDLLVGAVRRLSSYLDYNLLDSLYEVMLMLDNIHMSCFLAAQLPELTDLRQTEAFPSIHRIVSLLLAQQIRLLHDDGSSGWIEDPLTFPICRELLYQSASECTKDVQIRLELLRWIHIGVRFYPMGYLRKNLINESQRVALHTLLEFYYFTIGQEVKSVEERKERQRYTLFHELCRLDPSLKAKKSFVFHSQADLMKELKHKVISIDLLRKMSDAFNWEYQQMLVSQILTFFGQQEPSFTVQTDAYGREKVVIHDKPEAMMARLSPYLAEVENAVMLCSKLTKYMEHANGYFYEQFFCIFDILAQFSEISDEIRIWRNILRFMQEHLSGRRRQRPGQLEQEAWMREHPDGDMLPEIAKYRYPFMLIVRQPLKQLLKEEIAIDNYQKLLVLVEMKCALEGFDCNEMNDNFCKSAVVNSINEYKIQNKEMALAHNDWHRQAKNKAFLQSILRIVDSIKDLSSRLFILYYITCNASDGDDQVNAAYACYTFARKHETELASMPEAKEKLEKIFRKYPLLKTQQLLQQNGVTEEKQFQLVRNPHELIMALYSDSCFQQVKVNELVSVIGELYELDIEGIQMQLLQKWLTIFGGTTSENSASMLEETLYDDHNMSDASQEDEEGVHEYMKRAYYILSSWERSKSVEFLVAQLNTSTDGVSSDVGKQLHIYQCFSKLVDEECNPYQTFFTQQRYVALKCVHLLKSLGLGNLSIAKFEETDKMALLKMLWQSHASNPKGLEVIALICIGYNIYLPQIWNGILKQMARLGMVANLRALIDIVTAKRQLFGLEGYRMAWELLIEQPFRSASREQSLAEDALLARSLVMVQRCPISFRLNLLEIARECVTVNRVNMAAVLIGFADSEQKETLKKLIANNAVPNLKDQIQELEEFGLVTTITKAVCSELSLRDMPLQNGTSKRRAD